MAVPKRNRGWIWFFLVLALLSATGIIILRMAVLSRQIQPEQLAAARAKWDAKGPRNYDLDYTKKGASEGTVFVKVRHGEVVSAEPDERPLEEKRAYYGMPALFDYIERFLEIDAQPGAPRSFATARFDDEDGHLIHYLRRAGGTREELELIVHLKPVAEDDPTNVPSGVKKSPEAKKGAAQE
jgi:hypothetical protein